MTITFKSNDKDLAHYNYLYWIIGNMKKVVEKDRDTDERFIKRLKTYEVEFKELKEKLKRRGL